MTIDLAPALVRTLRADYPNCLRTTADMTTLVEEILWSWCRDRRRVAALLSEHPADDPTDPTTSTASALAA